MIMQAKCFLDIKALGGESEDMPHDAVLSKAMHILHGAFASSDTGYAVSFPEASQGKKRFVGGAIRIFASSSADLYSLIEKVKGHNFMRDYVGMSMPRDVPADFAGTWSIWRRIRVQKIEGINKEKTLQRAHSSIFFEMKSSSGHGFPLRVYKELATAQVDGFTPNSYGLASQGNMFSLPDVR